MKADRFLRCREVCHLASLSESQIYRRLAAGTFPKPITLGPGSVRWSYREVQAWIHDVKAEQAERRAAS